MASIPEITGRTHPYPLGYQPIVRLDAHGLTGTAYSELLTDVSGPGTTNAAAIQALERSGGIEPVDSANLLYAIRALHAGGLGGCPLVGVNLSGRTLSDPDWLAWSLGVLDGEPIVAGKLLIEITESYPVTSLDALLSWRLGLQARHVRVALDDFGSRHGQHPEDGIERLSPDVVKADGSVVAGEGDVALGELVARADHVGSEVVAERVECETMLNALFAQGCSMVQGFAVAPPVPLMNQEYAHA